jgi:hypothetical protein
VADGFEPVAEEVETEGMFDAHRVHVEDAAAHAELAHPVDGGHPLKAGVDQVGDHRVQVRDLGACQAQGAQFEGVGGDEGGDQGGGRSHDDGGLPSQQTGGGLDAQAGDLRGGRALVVETHVPGGEVAHHLLAGDGLQIVAPLLGLVLVWGHHQQGPPQAALHVDQQEGPQSVGQTLQ